MKKSNEWVRNADLHKMLDKLCEDQRVEPEDLITNDIAKTLSLEPNGEFYRKVQSWRQRRIAERNADLPQIPPSAQDEFRAELDRFVETAMDVYVRSLRAVSVDINRTAELRVGDAVRRAVDAKSEASDLLDKWSETEHERDAAKELVAALEAELFEVRRQLEHTRGQLQATERAVAMLGHQPVEPDATDEPVPSVSSDTALAMSQALHGESDDTAASEHSVLIPDVAVAAGTRPTGSQAVLPLVSGEASTDATAEVRDHE